MLGIRLARSIQEDSADKGKKDTMAHTGTMVNAEGKEKEAGVWGKTSNWVDYSGDVDGEKVGVAIFPPALTAGASFLVLAPDDHWLWAAKAALI